MPFWLVVKRCVCQSADTSDDTAAADAGKLAGCTLLTSPMTVLHPLHGSNDPNNFKRTLSELMPTYVILYDADMSFVRQLEVAFLGHLLLIVCQNLCFLVKMHLH